MCVLLPMCHDKYFHYSEKKIDLEKTFEPSLLNSTVYIISMTLQISTFAINYRVSVAHYGAFHVSSTVQIPDPFF